MILQIWSLFSAGNHSICSPNDLFYWPCYLFMDILDTGWVFILTLRWGQEITGHILVLVKVIWLQSAWFVSKTLAIRHFDQLEACSFLSNFHPLIQQFFLVQWRSEYGCNNSTTMNRNIEIRIALDSIGILKERRLKVNVDLVLFERNKAHYSYLSVKYCVQNTFRFFLETHHSRNDQNSSSVPPN